MALPHSRLFLKLSLLAENGSPKSCLEAAVQAGDVAALLVDGRAGMEFMADITEMVSVAQAHDVAALIVEDVELVGRTGADGIQIAADAAEYASVRKQLGEHAIVGVAAGTSRHAAMELAEAGASYVSFDDVSADECLSSWWADVMEVPCVAHVEASEQAIIEGAQAGIEFLCPDETIWRSPETAASAVARFNKVIGGNTVA